MTQQRPGPHNLPHDGDARVYVPNDERNTLEILDFLQRFVCNPLPALKREGDSQ